MADESTAVLEPTEAPAETPTEVVDLPEAAPEASTPEVPATPTDVVEQPPEPEAPVEEASFTKADLEGRVSTEIANQRRKWESESATSQERALEEARAQERAKYERESGSRHAVAAVWSEVLNTAGIDAQNLSTNNPALAQKLNQAFIANETWADATRAEALQELVVNKYDAIPASVIAQASNKRNTGDTEGWMLGLIEGAAEHRATQLVAERTESIERAANERVQAEHTAAQMQAVATAPAPPPGQYTSGQPTPIQYAAARPEPGALWAKDGIVVAIPS